MAASFGARTLLVEERRLGGECTWSGCVPSKALIKAARLARAIAGSGRYGIEASPLRIDPAALWRRIRGVRQRIYDDADDPRHYERFGAVVRFGRARFVDPHTLEVAGTDGSSGRVTARRFIVCAGSRPRVPAVEGLDSVPYHTNETIFELESLPRSLAVLGGGPVGCELAQAFRMLGAEVHLVQSAARLMPRDAPEVSDAIGRRFAADGIDARTGTRVEAVARGGGGIVVRGPGLEIAAEMLLVAVGRSPSTEGLGLGAAGVRFDRDGIAVDRRCRTSAPHIYAAGDVTAGMKFTHLAEHMAKVAVTNAILRWPLRVDADNVPWVTFVTPEAAHAGLGREQLDERGVKVREYRFPFSRIDRAVTDGEEEGWIRILARETSGRIYGVDIVGEGAGEMIAEYALAIRNRITLRRLADTIHPYPTYGLGNRRAADQWYVQKMSPAFVRVLQAVFGYRGRVPSRPAPGEVL